MNLAINHRCLLKSNVKRAPNHQRKRERNNSVEPQQPLEAPANPQEIQSNHQRSRNEPEIIQKMSVLNKRRSKSQYARSSNGLNEVVCTTSAFGYDANQWQQKKNCQQ